MKRQRRVDPRICKALLADEAPCLGCNKKIGCHRKHKPAQCKGPCSAPLCNADASVIGGDAEMRTPAPNKEEWAIWSSALRTVNCVKSMACNTR